ncbi:hypothetical protein GCM10009534_65040 [Kribbella sandramycini]
MAGAIAGTGRAGQNTGATPGAAITCPLTRTRTPSRTSNPSLPRPVRPATDSATPVTATGAGAGAAPATTPPGSGNTTKTPAPNTATHPATTAGTHRRPTPSTIIRRLPLTQLH